MIGALKAINLGIVPYLIGGGILFVAGGELIGGYKANKAKEECGAIQRTIIQNALEQAEELASQWEAENQKARRLQRRVEALQGSLRQAEQEIEISSRERETEIEIATENLAQCLLNEDTRRILNTWMLDEEYREDLSDYWR